jgi:hypothetical protein
MEIRKTGYYWRQAGKLLVRVSACLLMLLYLANTISAQSVYVKASINRDKILIGEPITLSLEANVPEGQTANWFTLDSIPHFEFIEKGKIDTSAEGSGTVYRQNIQITSFDSGRWVVSSLGLDVGGRSYLTDSLPVSVAFSNFDAAQPYHDIKDILAVETLNQRNVIIVIAAVTLISLLLLIYLLRKPVEKLLKAEKKFTGSQTPVELALKALEELKAQRLPEQGQVKAYYTSMNNILREFITRKTGNSVKEKTSDELGMYLKDIRMENNSFIALVQTLRMSDAVKFAKYVPDSSDNDASFDVFRKSIESLNNL